MRISLQKHLWRFLLSKNCRDVFILNFLFISLSSIDHLKVVATISPPPCPLTPSKLLLKYMWKNLITKRRLFPWNDIWRPVLTSFDFPFWPYFTLNYIEWGHMTLFLPKMTPRIIIWPRLSWPYIIWLDQAIFLISQDIR